MKKMVRFILIVAIVMSFTLSALAVNLTDIDSSWAKGYILQLVNRGAINGYVDGTFRPNNTITRAEFTKILLVSMGEDPGKPETGYWATNYLSSAAAKGLIKAGEFSNADLNISRMEITKMIVRALGKEKEAADRVGKPTGFKDDDTISDANKGYVIVTKAYGVISGRPDGTFAPNASANRAEAAKMIVTYLNNKDNSIDWAKVDAGTNTSNTDNSRTAVKLTDDPVLNEIIKKYTGFKQLPFTTPNATLITLNKNRTEINFDVMHTKGEVGTGTVRMYEDTPQTREILKYILDVFNPDNSEVIYNTAISVIENKKSSYNNPMGNNYFYNISYINPFGRETGGVAINIRQE